MPAGNNVTQFNPFPERYQALWVRPHLDAGLLRVRQAMERLGESGQGGSLIDEAREVLGHLNAVADVLPWPALRLCFDGMVDVLRRLQSRASPLSENEISQDVGLNAVVGACVLIPDYLDLLTRGDADSPLLLLPLINELRLAAGRGLLSEPELVARQLAAHPWPLRRQPGKLKASQFPALARKAAPYYQSSLLAIMRAQSDSRQHWARLGKLAEQLAEATPATAAHWLWSAVAAIVEAVLTDGLDVDIELKRLLGTIGQSLTQAGESQPVADSEVIRLALTSLYYVARATPAGRRVAALNVAWRLSVWVPSQAVIRQQRRRLQGSSPRLLAQVTRELKADFGEAKDCIDMAMRTGDPAQIATAVQGLSQVSDTLLGLGLRALGRHVAAQCAQLGQLELRRDLHRWEALATDLLRAESSLERALFAQTGEPEDDPPAPLSLDDGDGIAASRMALMQVVLADFARAKGLLDTAFRQRNADGLRELPTQFEQMAASVSVIDRPVLVQALQGIAALVRHTQLVTGGAETDTAQGFALLCTRTELAMEALRDGLFGEADVLPELDTTVQVLQARLSEAPGLPVIPATAATAPSLPDDLDGEMRDVFLEEASDVLATLDATVPLWRRHPEPSEALVTIRRAFHTLKGSGRMVGAHALGEFAWSVERLLNALLEGAEAIEPDVVQWLARAHAVLPGVLHAYRHGEPIPDNALAVAGEAQQRLQGSVVTEQMRVVFRNDATEKLDLIQEWLDSDDGGRVPEAVTRAFHTLRGAANLVGLSGMGDISAECENWLQGLASVQRGLDAAGSALLGRLVAEKRAWVDALGRDPSLSIDADLWLTRLREAANAAPGADQAVFAARQMIDTFSIEALDLLDAIEARVRAWQAAPEHNEPGQAIQTDLHTLAGGASVANAAAMAGAARALREQLQAAPLAPSGINALPSVVEALRQLLDAYRDGRASDNVPDELQRAIAQLGVGPMEVADVAVESETIKSEPDPDPAPAEPMDAAPADPPPVMPEPVAVTEDGGDALPGASTATPLEAAGAGPEEITHPLPEPADDEELRDIFFAEAQELLDTLDHLSQQWSLQPESPEPATETQRVLHTLKGSARTAGYERLGGVAAQLEDEVKSLQGQTLPMHLFSRLEDVTARLRRDLRTLIDGGGDVFSQWEAAPLLEVPAGEGSDDRPYDDQVGTSQGEQTPAMSGPAPMVATSVEDDAAVLRVIFAEEATELLESIEAAQARWRDNPADGRPRDDTLRALHTLKGGARMCDWASLADAAHELESAIERDAPPPGQPVSDGGLERVAEGVRQLHELLERGAERAEPPAAAGEPAVSPAVLSAGPETQRAWDPRLFFVPETLRESGAQRPDTARVPVDRLDRMLNEVGEVAIVRARLDAQMGQARSQLAEMTQAVDRLRDQLRQMDAETDAQVRARGMGGVGGEVGRVDEDRYADAFDPLEMDRYTRMQELSRSLNESLGDIAGLHDSLRDVVTDCDTLLLQQDRANSSLQDGLMSALMVPFSRQVARLQRVVRNTALELDKQVTLEVSGEDAEVDRNVLERMTAPLEHVLRNAVVHGIEPPAQRLASGKPAGGTVRVSLRRDGSELLMNIDDDGSGLDYARIEAVAVRKALLPAPIPAADPRREAELARFIFEPGFSTAESLSQTAGRGIGMDVVAAEVKQLGGGIIVQSPSGQGTRFEIRLPLTLAVSNALFVSVNGRQFALPLTNIAGLVRLNKDDAARYLAAPSAQLEYGGTKYQVRQLAELLGEPIRDLSANDTAPQAVLLRPRDVTADATPVAVLPDAVFGNREIIAKPVGPIVGAINGVSSATILPDGEVVLVLDPAVLSQARSRQARTFVGADEGGGAPLVMVVDDSITIRRVTQRLLGRNGYRVVTAKDGLDAMGQLASITPDVVFLDIEMPRADGFEVASYIRNTERLSHLPIVMITSRSGDKHRSRAAAIGVNHYLIKPYQETELMAVLKSFVVVGGVR